MECKCKTLTLIQFYFVAEHEKWGNEHDCFYEPGKLRVCLVVSLRQRTKTEFWSKQKLTLHIVHKIKACKTSVKHPFIFALKEAFWELWKFSTKFKIFFFLLIGSDKIIDANRFDAYLSWLAPQAKNTEDNANDKATFSFLSFFSVTGVDRLSLVLGSQDLWWDWGAADPFWESLASWHYSHQQVSLAWPQQGFFSVIRQSWKY